MPQNALIDGVLECATEEDLEVVRQVLAVVGLDVLGDSGGARAGPLLKMDESVRNHPRVGRLPVALLLGQLLLGRGRALGRRRGLLGFFLLLAVADHLRRLERRLDERHVVCGLALHLLGPTRDGFSRHGGSVRGREEV